MKTARLGDILDFRNGRSFMKSEWRTKGLPIIRIQNLNDKDASFNHFMGEYDKGIEIHQGDLLFSWSGTVGTSFGPHIWNGETGVLNQHIFKLSKKVEIECRYLYYALKDITSEIEKQTHGAGGLVHITKEKLIRFKIPMPDIEEQRRVVERLDAAFEKIDRAIELTEKNIEKINSLRLVATRNLLERVDGQEKTVGEVIKLEYGKPLDRVDRKRNGKFAAYGANGIKDMTDRYYWDVPSIIIGRKGSAGELTRVNEPFWPLDVTYYVTHDNTETNLDYIFYMLDSLNLPSLARGVKPGINRNDVYSLPFKLPVIEEQEATAKKIDTLCEQTKNLTEQHRNKVVTLKALKQSLLNQAFSQSEVE